MNDLAQWVVEQNLITAEQLGRARELQRQTGVPFAMALIELNLIDEKTIVELVATRHGLPKAPRRLHKITVPPKALSLIPQDYCWQYNVFPFGIDTVARRLQLAIVDPSDVEAVAALSKIARLELALFVAGPRQIEKGIRRHYLDSWVDETAAPGKRPRYFGYDNITNPGVVAKRPVTGGAPGAVEDDGAEAPGAQPEQVAPAADSPPPVVPVPPLLTGEADLTWESGEVPQAQDPSGLEPADAEPDLPVLRELPTAPSRPVGRMQTSDGRGEVMIRLDRIERTLAELLELLSGTSQDKASKLMQLNDFLKSTPHR